jgi:hypothetical protein
VRLAALENDEFVISFRNETLDSIAFKAVLLERGIIRAEAKGSLRRWEGTLTRIDYDVKVHEGILRWLMSLVIASLLLMIIPPIIFFIAAKINILVWLSISIGFLVMMVGVILMVNHYAPIDDTPQSLIKIIGSALDQ